MYMDWAPILVLPVDGSPPTLTSTYWAVHSVYTVIDATSGLASDYDTGVFIPTALWTYSVAAVPLPPSALLLGSGLLGLGLLGYRRKRG